MDTGGIESAAMLWRLVVDITGDGGWWGGTDMTRLCSEELASRPQSC
jgi:hypothetical protein